MLRSGAYCDLTSTPASDLTLNSSRVCLSRRPDDGLCGVSGDAGTTVTIVIFAPTLIVIGLGV